MSRKQGNKLMHSNFVVLGDGITEQYYLKHLKDINGYKYSIRPSLFTNITIESAEYIIDELLSGACDHIVYITDYDTIVNQNKKDKFDALVDKYKGRENILICESMPSIEFWFLLHFVRTTREFCDASQATKELLKYIKGYSKNRGFLENAKWARELCKNGRLEVALSNSNTILKQRNSNTQSRHSPYSRIHLGIEQFNKHKGKEK